MFSKDVKHKMSIGTLKNSVEFDIVFRNATKFNRNSVTIYAMPLNLFCGHLKKKKKFFRNIDSCNVVGFSINKKVAKACKRNLLRRRIKAILHNLTLQNIINGYVLVFICRKGSTDMDFRFLEQHISYSLNKLIR